jgi:hypothetical protein
MMERIEPSILERYLAQDDVAARSARADPVLIGRLTSQRWLNETPAKRLIFSRLYGDILDAPSERRVLDVGGGLTALTPTLAAHARYTLLDPLFHEDAAALSHVRSAGAEFDVVGEDWHTWPGSDAFDVVIANDLFPNVDQRLTLFVSWAAARAREVRLSLTFYNKPRWYRTKRIDADEHFTVLAFDGLSTAAAMVPFADRIDGWNPSLFEGVGGSAFPNGRQVVLVTVRGDRA